MSDTPEAAAGSGAPDVSIIIVSYNTKETTLQAVGSLLETSGDVNLEVIVVDNVSSDGSSEALRDAYPEITVIDAPVNGGFGYGNNVGIAASRGRYLLVLNPDTIMRAGTLAACIEHMDANPDVGMLGCRVTYEDGSLQSTVFRHPRLRFLIAGVVAPHRLQQKTTIFGDQRYATLDRSRPQDVETVVGCFMMFPRSVLDKVGPFDERFFMYSEETELCHRVRRAGFKVRYFPEAEVVHIGGVSTGETSPWKHVEIARGQLLFLRITRGPMVAYLGVLIMLLGDIVRGLYFIPARLIKGPEGTARWWARFRFLLGALIDPPKGQATPGGPR